MTAPPNGETFPRRTHTADLCVVGGGMAGLSAAIVAARHGAKVVLMQDRPVLGGNASSETRVHICGADRHNRFANLRETGLLEQLRLTNLRFNPQRSFSVWDTVLYDACRREKNLTLLLNCSCCDADVQGRRVAAVIGWSLTEQTRHRVEAALFADCSGDGILAPLTGAGFRVGREAREEYDEPNAPDQADRMTMGMSLCFQTRLHDAPQPFEPPDWAYTFDDCDELPYGQRGHERHWEMGYWWVELGGEADSIHDTDACRDELLRIAYGVWDHIKNRCHATRQRAANWALEWMQFLPAKRESRRYLGAHVLTQNDVLAEGRFDDRVAYGGWTMDDHPPTGFWGKRKGVTLPSAVHNEAPSPYGIPYRSLYARDVDNLLFAGRCASATHMGMSSTRVMGTGCSMGLAVGVAAAIAAREGIDPAGVGESHLDELQQTLLRDDAYIPWVPQRFSEPTMRATIETSSGDGQAVRDGVSRPVGDDPHGWPCREGDWIALRWDEPVEIAEVRLVVDSALHKDIQMSFHNPIETQQTVLPEELPRRWRIDVLAGGEWAPLAEENDSYDRLLRRPVARPVHGVRWTLLETWGHEPSRVHAFYVD